MAKKECQKHAVGITRLADQSSERACHGWLACTLDHVLPSSALAGKKARWRLMIIRKR